MKTMIKKIVLVSLVALSANSVNAMFDTEEFGAVAYSQEMLRLAKNYAESSYVKATATAGLGMDAFFTEAEKKTSYLPDLALQLSDEQGRKLYQHLNNINSKIDLAAHEALKLVKERKGDSDFKAEKELVVTEAQKVLHAIAFNDDVFKKTVALYTNLLREVIELDETNLDYYLSRNAQLLQIVGLSAKEENLTNSFFTIVGANIKQYKYIQAFLYGEAKVDSTTKMEEAIAKFLVKNGMKYAQAKKVEASEFTFKDTSDVRQNIESFQFNLAMRHQVARFQARCDLERKFNALQEFALNVYTKEKNRSGLTGSFLGDAGLGLGVVAAIVLGYGYACKQEAISKDYTTVRWPWEKALLPLATRVGIITKAE